MEPIEIDLRLKGGSIYATFEIDEPGCTLEFVESLLCKVLDSVWKFETGPYERKELM